MKSDTSRTRSGPRAWTSPSSEHWLPSANIYLTDWPRDQEVIRVFIDIQQFDVDSSGQGILNAHWRITPSDSDQQLKTGDARLSRTGASPHGHPEMVATTLSDLTAEFSRELAQSIRESEQPSR